MAGIVPHAGWIYSGATAAKVFKCINEKSNPSTFIIFGAAHRGGRRNSVYARGSWITPFGEVGVDEKVASTILESSNYFVEDEHAHVGEHSIEVQLPIIKYFFPMAEIVPITMPPRKDSHIAGQEIFKSINKLNKEIIIIGTTDFTHYGDNYGFAPSGFGPSALDWMKNNDSRIINLILKIKSDQIVEEAATHQNACGSGAVAATISVVKEMGVNRGFLLEYTTSYDVKPNGCTFEMGVGYAGVIF